MSIVTNDLDSMKKRLVANAQGNDNSAPVFRRLVESWHSTANMSIISMCAFLMQGGAAAYSLFDNILNQLKAMRANGILSFAGVLHCRREVLLVACRLGNLVLC